MSTELLPGKLGSSQFAKSVEKQDGWTEHQKVFPQEFKKKKKKRVLTLLIKFGKRRITEGAQLKISTPKSPRGRMQ